LKIILFLFPIVLFLFFVSIKLLSPDTYRFIIEEDSFVEYAQALLFFIASIMSFYVSITFLRKKLILHSILYAVLASGLLLVSVEEISWGQRIFNMASPAFFEQHNWQHEISLHNLDVIQLSLLNKIYILIGAYGAFAWLLLRPFAARLKNESCHVVNFIVPDWYMSSYFFFVFLVYMLLNFIKQYPGGFLVWNDQEPAELLLSMGFLLFVVKNYFILRLCPINASHFGNLGKLNSATIIISARQLLITFVPSMLILVALVMANIFFHVSISSMTRDVTHIANIHPLFGVLSNLGIILWCVAATVCFFTAVALRNTKRGDRFRFLLCSALLSTYLMADDFFQIHEYLAPKYLGLNEGVVFTALGIAILVYLIVFRRIILETKFGFLVLAMVLFAFSIFTDSIIVSFLLRTLGDDGEHLLEDGSKWLGIASWCSYYVYTSYQFLVDQDGTSHHVVQSDARFPESNISNQEENVSDSTKKPMGFRKIWNNYRIYIIGITIVIVAISLVFAVSEKTKVSISDNEINRMETPEIEASATSNNVSADDLFNSALAICSSNKCINPKKATEYLNQAIKLRPDFAEAYGMRGNVYQKRGQYQNAVENYNEVLKLNPGDPRAYFNRGTAYLMLGNEKFGCPDLHKACDLGYCDALEWAKRKGICR